MRPRNGTGLTVTAAALLLLATVATGLYLGVQTRRQFLEISESWSGYANEADRKGALISAIRGQLGYGGIIHTFKNYVLRQDQWYRQRLVETLREFDSATAEYLSLPISPPERRAIETLVGTIDIYREKLAIADTAAELGWSAERTDALVRVDDTNALAALSGLERIWQSARSKQSERLFLSVERGRELIGIGFFSMALLVLASLVLAYTFWSILRQMQRALEQRSEELKRRRSVERSEQRLAQAVEQSPASIMITDTDGRLEYVNRHFEELSGWSREEVIGKTPKFLQSGDTEAAEYKRMQSLLRDGQSWRGILHNLKKDGGNYWIESTILPLREPDGEAHSYLGIGEDITERLRAREHIARAQKIEAVGLLAGGIAHDFNSVLTSILGSAHLAALDAPEDSNLAREVEQIEIAARRAQLLVQQLLGFARRKAGNPVPTDVRDVVRQALRLVRASTAPTTRFEFEDQDDPVWVAADPTHLHQIVMNLCGNAAEAIGGHAGTVEVQISTETGAGDEGNGKTRTWACLTVRDNGPGMAEDVRRRVFDAFFTTKPMGKGTGLGLAVVHGLVGDIGGTIDVESRPGEGATFRVRLPVCPPPDQPADGKSDLMPYGTERLLVVDDEPEVAATLRRSLTRYGYRVEAFSSSPAALRAFETAPDRFDVVISDIVMPDINGAELVAQLRRARPSLPIIFLTGFATQIEGVTGPKPLMIEKPIDPLALAQALRTLLDRN